MPKLSLPAVIARPAAYATGLFASKAVALIMLPVVANRLTITQVGQLELYTSSSVFLAMLLGLAMHEALYRFAGQEQSQPKQAAVAAEIISLAGIVALCALTLLLVTLSILHNRSPELPTLHLSLLAVGICSEGLIALLLAWLRMRDRAGDFVRVTLSVCLLQVTLVLLSLGFYPGITGILTASVIAHLIQLLWLYKLCQLPLQQPARRQTVRYVRYSVPIALAGLLAFVLNGAERWAIAAYDSIDVLAQYAIAAKFALALCILVQPFGMWWMPRRFAVLEGNEGEPGKGKLAATKTTQYGLVWIATLCAFMAYFAPLFITLALPSGYQAAGQLVLLCLVAAVCKEVTELVNLGLLANKKTGLLLKFNLIATVTGVASAVLLRPFAIWGILCALVLAQALKLVLVYRASQRLTPLPYRLKALNGLYIAALLHLLASTQLHDWRGLALLALLAPLSMLTIAAATRLLPLPVLKQYQGSNLTGTLYNQKQADHR